MADTNVTIVAGRLTKDAESTTTKSGFCITRFTVASGEYSKKEQDNTYTNYVDVKYFGEDRKDLKKGTSVTCFGRIHQDRWESNGKKESKLVVVADCVVAKTSSRPSVPKAPDVGGPESFPDDDIPEF